MEPIKRMVSSAAQVPRMAKMAPKITKICLLYAAAISVSFFVIFMSSRYSSSGDFGFRNDFVDDHENTLNESQFFCLKNIPEIKKTFSHFKRFTDGFPQMTRQEISNTPKGLGTVIVYNNYISPELNITGNESVTLCSHASTEYLHHISELCSRWQGPISVSVFVADVQKTLKQISFFRRCSPSSQCILEFVSWHLVLVTNSKFAKDTEVPLNFQDSGFNCSRNEPINHRKKSKMTYPINICRNVARANARTFYVLVSDIELYPSLGIIPKFLAMSKLGRRTVYTLALFEVSADQYVPRTREELDELFRKKKAVHFHQYICPECQFFPKKEMWMKNSTSPDQRCLSVLTVAKRQKRYKHWEPIYIGTQDEPEYLETLSWEGKRDKMSQAFEMCLQNYNFAVLQNVFLCHSSGIKKFDANDHSRRSPYMLQNRRAEFLHRRKLMQKYSRRRITQCA